MRNYFKSLFVLFLFFSIAENSFAQQDKKPNQEFQIYLNRPAKSIKLLMYEKNFVPIQGRLSEDKKSIIIRDYERGSKVHVKVEYEDGTVDEFVRSPCYIDPFIVLDKSIFYSSPIALL